MGRIYGCDGGQVGAGAGKFEKYNKMCCVYEILCLCFSLFVAQRGYSRCELKPVFDPVEYVNPLMGTQSTFELSAGNTYPAIARPWGMNFWMPQTGKMGDGWAYVYTANKIRGFKQTHQPSPWINDYGQFSLMPVVGEPEFDQDRRASWFSHKGEVAKPIITRFTWRSTMW